MQTINEVLDELKVQVVTIAKRKMHSEAGELVLTTDQAYNNGGEDGGIDFARHLMEQFPEVFGSVYDPTEADEEDEEQDAPNTLDLPKVEDLVFVLDWNLEPAVMVEQITQAVVKLREQGVIA